MAKISSISDYIEFEFSCLKPGPQIPFDIYLYFPKNEKLVHWKKKGDVITDDFLLAAGSKGIRNLWIHRNDKDVFYDYLHGKDHSNSANLPPAQPPDEQKVKELANRINKLLFSNDMPEGEKSKLISKLSRSVLNKVLESRPDGISERANTVAHKTVQEMIVPPKLPDSEAPKTQEQKTTIMVTEMYDLVQTNSHIEHAANVATLSVIFAMGFGRIDTELLLDLALAGLIHDIGLTQLPSSMVSLPQEKLSLEKDSAYQMHSEESIGLIAELAPDISDRVKMIVAQHHEKFNGTGFPRGLKGFQFDDIAQLLAIADYIDTVSSGNWDNLPRSLSESLDFIENIEKIRNYPEHFNPELFSAILKWVRSGDAGEAAVNADQIVSGKAEEILAEEKQAS